MKVKIEISLKDGVLDPQAKTIYSALIGLGYNDIKNVKMVKTIILEIDVQSKSEALRKAKEISDKILANPVIEVYNIEVLS